MATGEIHIHTQGLSGDEGMVFDPTPGRCGDLLKDPTIRFVNQPDFRGWWALSFEDLERAYLAAKALRE